MTAATPNPWARRIPRTAAEWVDHDVRATNRLYEWGSEHLEELVQGEPRDHYRHIAHSISTWTNVYLWEALRRTDPDLADRVAADIADACDAGDSFGEWAWQWQTELAAGQPLTLPAMPVDELGQGEALATYQAETRRLRAAIDAEADYHDDNRLHHFASRLRRILEDGPR